MDWSVKRDILSEFSWSLHLSRYPKQFRYDVITSGIRGYEAQCSASDAGKTGEDPTAFSFKVEGTLSPA